jgi:hypothetical protein
MARFNLSKEDKVKLILKVNDDYQRRCEMIWDDTLGELEMIYDISEEEVDEALNSGNLH